MNRYLRLFLREGELPYLVLGEFIDFFAKEL